MSALAHNVVEFGRLLRRAGLPVGPADMLAAAQALTRIDIGQPAEFRAALHATLVHRRDQAEVFDAAFALFWRGPAVLDAEAAMALLGEAVPPASAPPATRRVAEAFSSRRQEREAAEAGPRPDAANSVSDAERLQTLDFEAMSAAEIAGAKAEIARLSLPLDLRPTRRTRPSRRGERVDLAATARAALRNGGELLDLRFTRRVTRPPPLVVLCDISGSMGRYAAVLLHFLHAVVNDRDRVSTFLFGTRLTNITRQLRHRDPEAAFAAVAALVPDWSGGTRIGEAVERFNRDWARRVLGQGAVVLLVTDGLDRGAADGLGAAMERLHRSCTRLIWLNPLLRWDGFEPRSQGIRAMLPHVDEFRPVHNLRSLRALIAALSRPAPPRGRLVEPRP